MPLPTSKLLFIGVWRRRHSLFVPWLMLHAALLFEAALALAYLTFRLLSDTVSSLIPRLVENNRLNPPGKRE